jgi:hypothetical protein
MTQCILVSGFQQFVSPLKMKTVWSSEVFILPDYPVSHETAHHEVMNTVFHAFTPHIKSTLAA